MSFTEEDLNNLSSLARIDILPDEKEKMLADMQAILGYVSEINEVEGNIQDANFDLYNVVREDVATNERGVNTKALLDEAPATEDGYVKVEQVFR